ncbi:hypothetical protein AB6831_04125 [Carnobacterium divergens]|uniref:hypothetical protein n=1 Tax=Carnobacterium divergens TaxID=2748 RepID=UPI0039C9D8B7
MTVNNIVDTHMKIINNTLLIAVGEALNYSWDAEYKIRNIKNMLQNAVDEMDKELDGRLKNLNLTLEEMKQLRFGIWDDESNLRLIPIWLAPFIVQTTKVTSISGNIKTLKKADRDHRGGFLAYGVNPIMEDEK